jgi:tRNA A37 threonylcarbamoyladenosine dehydratase
MDGFSRVKLLLGEEGYEKLKNSRVAVFGIGGVGGYVAEALCRSGVGSIDIIDSDTVDISNLNRQIIATVSTVGKDKIEVMKDRLLSINPDLKITPIKTFYLPENADCVDISTYDYVVDAIDTVSAKIEIIERAYKNGVKVISSMGTGGKLHAELLKVAKIEDTKVCPLARVMRKELKDRNIFGIKVVYSEEEPYKNTDKSEKKADGKTAPPSMIFVPASAGLLIAEQVVLDLIKEK